MKINRRYKTGGFSFDLFIIASANLFTTLGFGVTTELMASTTKGAKYIKRICHPKTFFASFFSYKKKRSLFNKKPLNFIKLGDFNIQI